MIRSLDFAGVYILPCPPNKEMIPANLNGEVMRMEKMQKTPVMQCKFRDVREGLDSLVVVMVVVRDRLIVKGKVVDRR